MDGDYNIVELETLTNEEFKKVISKELKKFQIKDRVISVEELPKKGFDFYACVSENPHDFGVITEVEQLGRVVKFIGHSEIKLADKMIDLHNTVGQVMMQANGRIVMAFDTEDKPKYFGWLNPSDYETANYQYVASQSIN